MAATALPSAEEAQRKEEALDYLRRLYQAVAVYELRLRAYAEQVQRNPVFGQIVPPPVLVLPIRVSDLTRSHAVADPLGKQTVREIPPPWTQATEPLAEWKARDERNRQFAEFERQWAREEEMSKRAAPSPESRARQDRLSGELHFVVMLIPGVAAGTESFRAFSKGDIVGGFIMIVVAGAEVIPFVKGVAAASRVAKVASQVERLAPGGARIGGTALWDDLRFANYSPGNRPVMTVPQAREFLQQSGVRGLEHFDLRFLRDAEFERLFGSAPLAHYGPRSGVAASEVAWTQGNRI
jgi:hypothetical protein